jgi:LPXTG-site transpeptidase (sortase) family protein
MKLIKNLLKQKKSLIIIFGCVIFILLIFSFNKLQGNNVVLNPKVITSAQRQIGLPLRLRIPKISVDSSIVNVGILADGTMDVPKGPDGAAWYQLGPRPGEIGSAVIDGHSGWKDGIPAIFDYLYKLRKGDKINIEDNKGATISFIVSAIRNYDPSADATNIFTSKDNLSHLNLITCTGDWNDVTKSTNKRLVIFADKE